MRRRERYIVNGVLVFGGLASIADIFIQYLEHRDNGNPFTWESYDGERTLKWALIGGTLGGVVGYGYYRLALLEESELPFHPDSYVRKVLTKENLRNNPELLDNTVKYKKKFQQWFESEFSNELVSSPTDVGSFAKRTAINSKYDLDIILPFKKSAYSSLEEMYKDVFNRMQSKLGGTYSIAKQGSSIGVLIEKGDICVQMDVVPGREINNYRLDKELNLFVRPDNFWENPSSKKISVLRQRTITVNQPEARKAIKLVKAYCQRNGIGIPSTYINQAVVESLRHEYIGANSSDAINFTNSLQFISRKLGNNSYWDHSNSNNNLNDKISLPDRYQYSNIMAADAGSILQNPRYLKEVFEV